MRSVVQQIVISQTNDTVLKCSLRLILIYIQGHMHKNTTSHVYACINSYLNTYTYTDLYTYTRH